MNFTSVVEQISCLQPTLELLFYWELGDRKHMHWHSVSLKTDGLLVDRGRFSREKGDASANPKTFSLPKHSPWEWHVCLFNHPHVCGHVCMMECLISKCGAHGTHSLSGILLESKQARNPRGGVGAAISWIQRSPKRMAASPHGSQAMSCETCMTFVQYI